MEPLRARRSAHDRPLASSSSSSPSAAAPTPAAPAAAPPAYPPSPYSHTKPSLTTRTRKPSLSDDALQRSRAAPRAGGGGGRGSGLWHRCGGGLEAMQHGESRILLGLTLVGAVVRYWKIGRPSSVVFDEVHFGGFANKYIQSRFFMDVHPPLAKLLITLVAWLSGFQGGQFDFKDIGREYAPDHVPYVAMRLLPATLGLALIPLSYLTLRALQLRPATALVGALFVTFENGLITQSRLILLDSPLIFFTALSVFFWVGFSNENDVARDRTGRVGPFSRRWWVWLTLTGLALGAVVSCKWVGLFTIATIGVFTVVQLWLLLGDLRVPVPLLARHFAARAACLIAVPAVFYVSMFAIHFAILSNSGEGDGFMSSEFQHTLRGHGMEDTFADVMIGSRLSIRHVHTQGGYLHSHPATYPGGSKQQQITLYPHRDDNNIWLVLNSTADGSIPDPETHAPPHNIPDRTTIVLHHPSTHKKLHSHDIRPQVTEVDYQNEVSAYGFEGFEGDANDYWVVEIDQQESEGRVAKKQLETLRTKFRLRHALTGCYLFSHKVKLPDWGFEQQEVTCNKNPSRENALWYIETNTHAMLPPDAKKVNYRRPSFLQKFAELQAVMWQTNQGLTDRHAYDSRPHSWPLLLRGINFWVKDHRQVYLIGNPFVWALSTLAVLSYAGVRGLLFLRAQRGYKDFAHSQVVFYDRIATFLFCGWFLHYIPFFLMGRQLFLHHYFPALYFALLLTATAFDLATARLRPRLRLVVVGALVGAAVLAWWTLSPLAYAGEWTRAKCERAKTWGKNWDFSCADFHPSYDAYHPTHVPSLDPAAASSAATSVAPAVQPGRAGFVPAEKAPESSAVPRAPHAPAGAGAAAPVHDEERDGPLFAPLGDDEREAAGREHAVQHDGEGEKDKEEEEAHVTRVVADQPAAPPQLQHGGGGDEAREGVAIPAAAEGTSALPVRAIVQAEEAGGGRAAGHAAQEEGEGERVVVEEKRSGSGSGSGEEDADIALDGDAAQVDEVVDVEQDEQDDIADEQ